MARRAADRCPCRVRGLWSGRDGAGLRLRWTGTRPTSPLADPCRSHERRSATACASLPLDGSATKTSRRAIPKCSKSSGPEMQNSIWCRLRTYRRQKTQVDQWEAQGYALKQLANWSGDPPDFISKALGGWAFGTRPEALRVHRLGWSESDGNANSQDSRYPSHL